MGRRVSQELLSGAGGGGSVVSDLNDLGDVNAGSPNDGDHLSWDVGTNKWIPEAPPSGTSPLTTKGDIHTFSTVDARLPLGTDGHVLTADSAQSLGIKWAAGGSGSDYWTDVVLGSDFSTTSASQQATNLKFTPAASKTYLVKVIGLCGTDTSNNMPQIGVTWPSAGLVRGAAWWAFPTSTAGALDFTTGGNDTSPNVASGVNSGDFCLEVLQALFVTDGSISGDFVVTLNIEAGGGPEAFLYAGSILQYREIA
jgi:hypothetical protein